MLHSSHPCRISTYAVSASFYLRLHLVFSLILYNFVTNFSTMFIFKLTYKKPLTDVELHLAAHREYLDKFFSAGFLVASGPREPRVGGVILCNVKTLEEAQRIISQDPFFKKDIADYEVTQFHVTKHNLSNFKDSFE